MHRSALVACSIFALTSTAGCGAPDYTCGPELEYVASAGRCMCINRGRYICDTPDDCYCEPPIPDAGAIPDDTGTADAGSGCDGTEIVCGGDCVDPTTDPAHCGDCDDACDAGYECRESTCIDPAVEVAAGPAHTCVRRASGSVWCWGSNTSGQLGDGTVVDRPSPVRVVDLPPVAQIAAAGFTFRTPEGSSCARTEAGAVWCWGNNEFGQVGDGMTEPVVRPVVVDGLPLARHVTVGFRRNCALTTARRVFCWGDNGTGAPTTPTESIPVGVVGAWAGDVDVWGGGGCVVRELGGTYCYAGADPWALVAGVAEATALSASAANCAVSSTGAVTCWGQAQSTGTGRTGTSDVAAENLPELSGVRAIDGSSYGFTTCAVHGEEGHVSCWGTDLVETIRRGTQIFAPRPVRIAGLSGIVDVATDGGHACAVRNDGAVLCWGNNFYGQLGDGTTMPTAEPLAVPGFP